MKEKFFILGVLICTLAWLCGCGSGNGGSDPDDEDTDTNSSSDSNLDNLDTDSNTDTHTGADSDSNSDTDTDSNTDSETSTDTDTDSDTDTDTDTDTNSDTDLDAGPDYEYDGSYPDGPYGFNDSIEGQIDPASLPTEPSVWTGQGDIIPNICLPNAEGTVVCLGNFYQSSDYDIILVNMTAMW